MPATLSETHFTCISKNAGKLLISLGCQMLSMSFILYWDTVCGSWEMQYEPGLPIFDIIVTPPPQSQLIFLMSTFFSILCLHISGLIIWPHIFSLPQLLKTETAFAMSSISPCFHNFFMTRLGEGSVFDWLGCIWEGGCKIVLSNSDRKVSKKDKICIFLEVVNRLKGYIQARQKKKKWD